MLSCFPEYSLTAFHVSCDPLTLKIMRIVVLLFVPVAQAHPAWASTLFRVKVFYDDPAQEGH